MLSTTDAEMWLLLDPCSPMLWTRRGHKHPRHNAILNLIMIS